MRIQRSQCAADRSGDPQGWRADEQSAPGAARCQLRLYARAIICVTRDDKKQRPENVNRLELRVLGRLNCVAPRSFARALASNAPVPSIGGVMNRNPLDRPGRANGVKRQLVIRKHVSRRMLH